MRIQLTISGGLAYFPGLARTRTLDVETLPAPAAEDIIEAVAASGFFALPAQVGVAPVGAADAQAHTITIDDGARSHTVRVLDCVDDPALLSLFRHVEAALESSPS